MQTRLIFLLLFVSLFNPVFAQQNTDAPRITFMLKNTLGYHRMFRVEGPGIAYGFTMSKRETIPCTWPVGSRLYFSRDGETTTGLILTVTAADEGKTLGTDTETMETAGIPPAKTARQTAKETVVIRLRNPSSQRRKVALISYEPDQTGNSTVIFTLAPLIGFKTVRFPVGTKLYVADDQQVNVVMSGKRIDNSKPFLTVQASDAGKTFNLP
ncbi:MAG: hypothetical protein H7319_03715 [Spirosoma sp.]|nr:hypothetical protein [Spirosoma sp.]